MRADLLLHTADLGGTIRGHGFGPGAVDIELEVAAPTAARACAIVEERVVAALGGEWPAVKVRAGAPRVVRG